MKLCLCRTASRLLMACVLMLAGCSTISSGLDTVKGWVGLGPDRVALRHLTLVTDEDADDKSAVRIDIVAVFDNSAALTLPALTGDWFVKRRKLVESLSDVIAVKSYEVPPGMLLKDVELPAHIKKALSARAYVELRGQDDQKAIDINTPSTVTLHVKKSAVVKIMKP